MPLTTPSRMPSRATSKFCAGKLSWVNCGVELAMRLGVKSLPLLATAAASRTACKGVICVPYCPIAVW